jgi:hypothetical protein
VGALCVVLVLQRVVCSRGDVVPSGGGYLTKVLLGGALVNAAHMWDCTGITLWVRGSTDPAMVTTFLCTRFFGLVGARVPKRALCRAGENPLLVCCVQGRLPLEFCIAVTHSGLLMA